MENYLTVLVCMYPEKSRISIFGASLLESFLLPVAIGGQSLTVT